MMYSEVDTAARFMGNLDIARAADAAESVLKRPE